MKPGMIIVSIAALALSVVAMQDTSAKAWGGWQGMNLRLSGSSYSITTLPDGTATSVPPFTADQHAIARGKYGRATLRSQTFAGEFAPAAPGQCPEGLPLRGVLTISFVLTYADGSLLSGTTTGENFYCTDGSVFRRQGAGIITGGARRFEGATGTWDVDALVQSSRLTGDLHVDLD
jgi:hypothetical protein